MRRGPDKHMVHGMWMTEAEAEERLHRSRITIQQWRYRHRRPNGKPALLVEAWDYYADVNAGRMQQHIGRPPKHKYKGRPAHVTQVAKRLGIPAGTLYSHLHNHRGGLDAAVKYYEAKRQKRAEAEILRIINGE